MIVTILLQVPEVVPMHIRSDTLCPGPVPGHGPWVRHVHGMGCPVRLLVSRSAVPVC